MRFNRVMYSLALCGAVVFHAYYTRWFSFYLLVLAVLLPLLSLAGCLLSLWKSRLSVTAVREIERGNGIRLRFSERCSSILPPPTRLVRMEVAESVINEKTRYDMELPGGRTRSFLLSPEHCGVVTCHIVRCSALDYLGLFALPMRLPGDCTTAVMPLPAPPVPQPDLSQLTHTRWRAKRGGSSEVYELRDYRPGDSMRDVHWKLTAKSEGVIVREPQTPVHGAVLIAFDCAGSPAAMDSVFDQLSWLSAWLLEHHVDHDVRWYDPTAGRIRTVAVADEAQREAMLHQALAVRLTDDNPSGAASVRVAPPSTWHYHITPATAVGAEAEDEQ